MLDTPRDNAHDPVEDHSPRQEWEAPALEELGSFEELTRSAPGNGGDIEATSGAPIP